jgi:hypothetical protein
MDREIQDWMVIEQLYTMCLHPDVLKKLKSLSVLRRNLLWGEQRYRGAGSQLHHQQHGWGGGKCSSYTAQQQGIQQHSAHVYGFPKK